MHALGIGWCVVQIGFERTRPYVTFFLVLKWGVLRYVLSCMALGQFFTRDGYEGSIRLGTRKCHPCTPILCKT